MPQLSLLLGPVHIDRNLLIHQMKNFVYANQKIMLYNFSLKRLVLLKETSKIAVVKF